METVTHQAICVVIEQFSSAKGGDLDESVSKLIQNSRGACSFLTSRKSLSAMTTKSRAQRSTQPLENIVYDKTFLGTVYDCLVRIWEVNDTGPFQNSKKAYSRTKLGQLDVLSFNAKL